MREREGMVLPSSPRLRSSSWGRQQGISPWPCAEDREPQGDWGHHKAHCHFTGPQQRGGGGGALQPSNLGSASALSKSGPIQTLPDFIKPAAAACNQLCVVG